MVRPLPKELLLSCLLLAVHAATHAETLTVGGDGARFASVREAVAVARNGDTIEVRDGVYEGNIVIDKSITIIGSGKPTLRGSRDGSVVTIRADGCVLRGLVIEHSGNDLQTEDSGILLKSSNNRIEDCELRDVLYGIYLFRSRGNAIRGNTIRGRSELEMGERGAGLHLWDSPANTIEDNLITETRDGLYVQSCNDNLIRRNRVTHLRYGLHYMFSDRNVFEDNLFSDNVAGAAIMYSNRIELRRNAFVRNRGFSSFGILFQECSDLVAEDNFIIDNASGIFMEALRKTTFRRNMIAGNDVALEMFTSSDGNTFTANSFIDNISPLRLIGKRTNTRWSADGVGNFWSDYDGYDLDGDGRGDVAHKIQNVFEYMEGNHPRLRIYLNSPAAQAMAMAEKTFPIIGGSNERDTEPLMRPISRATGNNEESNRAERSERASTDVRLSAISPPGSEPVGAWRVQWLSLVVSSVMLALAVGTLRSARIRRSQV